MPGDEVDVFVYCDPRRILPGSPQDDIVTIRAAKIISRSELIEPVRCVFFLRSEHHDVHRERFRGRALIDLQKEIAHSLEIAQSIARVPLTGRRINLEVRGLHMNPLTFGIFHTRRTKARTLSAI